MSGYVLLAYRNKPSVRWLTNLCWTIPSSPQYDTLLATLEVDWPVWLWLAGGLLVALGRRNYRVAATVLALLPILFYRNSFAYYYVVMLAPAAVLAAEFADWIMSLKLTALPNSAIATGLLGIVTLTAAVNLRPLFDDDVSRQRSVVAAVHEIFPAPVPYIDHSGMIGTFRKVNFFMSSWGIQNYRANGNPFVRDVIDRFRPPLLIANRSVLQPDHPDFQLLLPEDREILSASYVVYWEPIYVAGVQRSLTRGHSVTVPSPFPGMYRVEANCDTWVDGIRKSAADIVRVEKWPGSLHVQIADDCARDTDTVRLVWADAKSAPRRDPPTRSMYVGLY